MGQESGALSRLSCASRERQSALSAALSASNDVVLGGLRAVRSSCTDARAARAHFEEGGPLRGSGTASRRGIRFDSGEPAPLEELAGAGVGHGDSSARGEAGTLARNGHPGCSPGQRTLAGRIALSFARRVHFWLAGSAAGPSGYRRTDLTPIAVWAASTENRTAKSARGYSRPADLQSVLDRDRAGAVDRDSEAVVVEGDVGGLRTLLGCGAE